MKRHRMTEPGLDMTTFERGGLAETAASAHPLPGESIAELFGRLGERLAQRGADVVTMIVFGSCGAHDESLDALAGQCGRIDWPVTWLEGRSCLGHPIAGVQVHAVSGAAVETITCAGRPVGRVFQDAHARYASFGDIRPDDGRAAVPDQAQRTLEQLESALGCARMNMSHVVRTWFFNHDILDWYGAFNTVRTRFFADRGVFDGVVPASTGIGGANPAGTALVGAALAVQALTRGTSVRPVDSPLQCPALAYGSSFNRAVELSTPDLRRVWVSGTASIGPDGDTVHIDDVAAQVERTMEVVEAILHTAGMSYADVTRAVAYLSDPRSVGGVDAYAASHLPATPLIIAQADICRHDLLFEVELDAVAPART